MSLVTQTVTGYKCEWCEEVFPAASVFDDDKPEGYFVTVERVTESHNHSRSPQLFLCSKECFLEYIQYGIGHSTVPWQPIGREARR